MPLKRHTDEIVKNSQYRRKFRWINVCVYCGAPKECEDHVFPLAATNNLDITDRTIYKQGLNRVPACNECNLLAAMEPFFSIIEKRKYIQRKLKKRYKSLLDTKDWRMEELDEFGQTLRQNIVNAMLLKIALVKRINFPYYPN